MQSCGNQFAAAIEWWHSQSSDSCRLETVQLDVLLFRQLFLRCGQGGVGHEPVMSVCLHVCDAWASLASPHLDEELRDLLALVALQLDDLAELGVLDDVAVAAVFLGRENG